MACKTIAFFSNKGGVGKTFASVNLGMSLALSGNKVLIVDLDFQAGQDMARMMNLPGSFSILEISKTLKETGAEPGIIKRHASTHSSGLDFFPTIKNSREIGSVTPEMLLPFFRQATEEYEYILIDGGKTFSEGLISVLDFCNLILLVATPDILAVYQVKWCLEILQSLHFPMKMVRLILNRSESRGSVAWQEVRSAVPCEIFGHIPSDGKTVGLALNRGVPCVIDSPRSTVTEAFNKMAVSLKKDDIYMDAIAGSVERSTEGLTQTGEFWSKFGISQTSPGASTADPEYSVQDNEITALKKKIHELLIERLNLDGITVDNLSDPESVMRVKKSAETVVGNLLAEEAGGRISSHEERISIVRDIVNEALGLGPLEDLLADPSITDIMANNKDEIYVEKNGKLVRTKKNFVSNEKMRSIIDRIIAPLGRRLDESTPMVDARLPDGSRVNAIIPPLSLGGPMITIRKFGKERVSIEDLVVKFNSASPDMIDFLNACVIGRKNIIVSGGTGAGKTTLLNVISEFIPDNERIVTIEDAAELKLKKSHVGRLESRPRNVEGRGEVTIRDLFVNSLRMRPDRIVIGECRGSEVLDMLQAMNTGHDGSMTTLHANSTRDVITRLQAMILLSGIELPPRAINEMVSSAIDIIVHINRYSDGSRKITGVSEIIGLDESFQTQLKDVFIFKQTGLDENGKVLGSYQATGYVPQCFEELITSGQKLDVNMFNAPTG